MHVFSWHFSFSFWPSCSACPSCLLLIAVQMKVVMSRWRYSKHPEHILHSAELRDSVFLHIDTTVCTFFSQHTFCEQIFISPSVMKLILHGDWWSNKWLWAPCSYSARKWVKIDFVPLHHPTQCAQLPSLSHHTLRIQGSPWTAEVLLKTICEEPFFIRKVFVKGSF